jgi:flagellar motor protein MotB
MARNRQAHAGGHGWFVTFADLMGLLVSFFVMLVAFSNQDQQKLQIVAGSMRDAFGVQTNVRYSGIIEVNGLPTRPKLKNAAHIQPEDASATPTPDEHDRNREYGAELKHDQAFALAAASLRQALRDLPELAEASKHIMVEDTKEGLNIDIVDQEGRSMFAEGSKEPYEAHAGDHREACRAAQGNPLPHRDYRPHLGFENAVAGRVWALEPLHRSGQCGPPNPRREWHAFGQFLRRGRPGRHRSALPRRSVHCRQPPRDHHVDA